MGKIDGAGVKREEEISMLKKSLFYYISKF